MTKLYQISDCHVIDGNVDKFISCLQYIEKEQDCNVLLLTGDIVCNPKLEHYSRILKACEETMSCKNIFAIAGNHDDLTLMKKAFYGSRIKIKDRFDMGEYQLVFINTSVKPISKSAILGAGRVSNMDLSKLKNMTRKKRSIVIIHHPVVEVGSLWFQDIGIENRSDVLKSINQKTAAILCGHGHSFIVSDLCEGKQFMAPSSSYGFDHSVDFYKRTEEYGILAIDINDSMNSINATPIYLNK
jgi:Icc protein